MSKLWQLPQFILTWTGLPLFALGGTLFKWALRCEDLSRRK